MTISSDYFPTDAAGLPAARSPEVVELAVGDEFDLRIAPVAKQLGDATVRMLAYNGSVPGPTLCVQQGSELLVNRDSPAARPLWRSDSPRRRDLRCEHEPLKADRRPSVSEPERIED